MFCVACSFKAESVGEDLVKAPGLFGDSCVGGSEQCTRGIPSVYKRSSPAASYGECRGD